MDLRINIDPTQGIRGLKLIAIDAELTILNPNLTVEDEFEALCDAEAPVVVFEAGEGTIPSKGIPAGNYNIQYTTEASPSTDDWNPFLNNISIFNNDMVDLINLKVDQTAYDTKQAAQDVRLNDLEDKVGDSESGLIEDVNDLKAQVEAASTDLTTIEDDIEDLHDIQELFKPEWHTVLYPAVFLGGKQSVSDRVGIQMSFDTEDAGFFKWVVQYRWYKNDASEFGEWEEITSLVDNVFIDKPAVSSQLWGKVEPGLPKTALLEVRVRAETLFGTESLTTICDITAIEAFGEASVNQIVTKAILSDEYLTEVVEKVKKGSLTNLVKITLTVKSGGMVKVNSVWYESSGDTYDVFVERNSTVNLKASASLNWTIGGEAAGTDLETEIVNIENDTTVEATFL